MCLAGRHAEDVREVGAIEPVAQVQLTDLSVHGVHSRQCGAYLRAESRLLGDGGKATRVVHRMGRLV